MEATAAKYRSAVESSALRDAMALPSSMDVCSSQRSVERCWSFFRTEEITPVFVTQDRSAWRLQELVSQLSDLLSKITIQNGGYVDLPEVLVMPAVRTKPATLQIIRRGTAEFRFIDD